MQVGEDRSLAEEQEPLAAGRLVHHVARDEQRRAAGGELVEEVPEVAAQHRVEADGGLVEHEHLGLAEERRRERDARLLAAREPADETGGRCRRGRRARSPRRRARARDAEHAREVVEVLAHREVGVDRRGLGHVPDAAPQRRSCPPGRPSTRTSPAATTWTPTIARIRVDLPLPLGPSSPVTTPPSTRRVTSVVEDRRTAAIDAQAGDLDRRSHNTHPTTRAVGFAPMTVPVLLGRRRRAGRLAARGVRRGQAGVRRPRERATGRCSRSST